MEIRGFCLSSWRIWPGRMKLVRKFRHNFNSPHEILLFVRIFFIITVLPLLVRFMALPRLMDFLFRSAKGGGIGNRDNYVSTAVKFTDYLLGMNFWIYRKTCLKRTLVLYHFLCPVFQELSICFGVRPREDVFGDIRRGLDGHSWLVRDGEVFMEENPDLAKKYVITYRFPDNRPQDEVTIGI